MPRLRSAWLTMADPGDFVIDADLGIEPTEALGWEVVMQPWNEPGVDWNAFDAVYIGTPWDYPDDPEAFLDVLATIDASRATLVNPLELVHWNFEKHYLADLERRGAAIVPTSWRDDFDAAELDAFFAAHDTGRIVIKPRIGANAVDTFVLTDPVDEATVAQLERLFRCRPFLVQPFVPAIQSEGEYSLFYLGGEFSHAIRKTPKVGDFRVQEEHGADIAATDVPETLAAAADAAVALVAPEPVYGRVDFVRSEEGEWQLMELELIEPSLYLRMDPAAPGRFARAFDRYARRH